MRSNGASAEIAKPRRLPTNRIDRYPTAPSKTEMNATERIRVDAQACFSASEDLLASGKNRSAAFWIPHLLKTVQSRQSFSARLSSPYCATGSKRVSRGNDTNPSSISPARPAKYWLAWTINWRISVICLASRGQSQRDQWLAGQMIDFEIVARVDN